MIVGPLEEALSDFVLWYDRFLEQLPLKAFNDGMRRAHGYKAEPRPYQTVVLEDNGLYKIETREVRSQGFHSALVPQEDVLRRKLEDVPASHYFRILAPQFIHYNLFVKGLEFNIKTNKMFALLGHSLDRDIELPTSVYALSLYFETPQTMDTTAPKEEYPRTHFHAGGFGWTYQKGMTTTLLARPREGKIYTLQGPISVPKKYLGTGFVTGLLDTLGYGQERLQQRTAEAEISIN